MFKEVFFQNLSLWLTIQHILNEKKKDKNLFKKIFKKLPSISDLVFKVAKISNYLHNIHVYMKICGKQKVAALKREILAL